LDIQSEVNPGHVCSSRADPVAGILPSTTIRQQLLYCQAWEVILPRLTRLEGVLKTLGEHINLAFTFKPQLPVEAPTPTPFSLSLHSTSKIINS
jgi:hypothetical protein